MSRRFQSVILLTAFMILMGGCRAALPWLTDEDVSVVEEDLPAVDREFRAVWIATVANIDWPSEPGLPVEQQQEELIRILNRAAALNLNAVIFQVRPAADAIYDSPYEPWASYLSGEMGRPPLPSYDPLEFAIREAHKRGLELHAWFNPFRAGHPVDTSEVSPDHISRTNPELVHQYGDFMWLDPGHPEAWEHSRKVILDVLKRYDIDGVHFDDYFYPYRSYADGADFPDDESWQRALYEGTTMSRSDWRRNNVDRFIEQVYTDIKELKPHVKFGISPFGIWQPGHPRRTTGFNAHAELYADARLWLREGWVDYFTPQIYYRTEQVGQPYPVMLQWWVDQNEYGRHIWPGLYTSRIVTTDTTWPVDEISRQLYISRGFPGVTGAVHFSMQALMRSPDRFRDLLAAGPYAEQALVPTTPWLGNSVPGTPSLRVEKFPNALMVRMEPPDGEEVRSWVIRSRTGDRWDVDILPGEQKEFTLSGGGSSSHPDLITVSAVDRLGNKGYAARTTISGGHRVASDPGRPEVSRYISRDEWSAVSPAGSEAHGIRRNLAHNDTLRFRDLVVVTEDIISTHPLMDTDEWIPGIGLTDDRQVLPDTVAIRLFRNGVSETFHVPEGNSFNWYGYHISLLDITSQLPGAGNGSVELELSTLLSKSVDRGAAMKSGPAAQRIRVPHQIQKVTLHHTGSVEPLKADEDASEKVRALQKWSMEQRNWWDLPYHFLVDLDGNVYQGRDLRYAGDVNGEYDPRGHLKVGAIGNYNLQEPTGKQIEAIAELFAWALKKYDLEPGRIYGHNDWANTSGPGLHLRALLDDGTLEERVEYRILNIEQ